MRTGELQKAVHDLIEGRISAEDHARLQQEFRENPESLAYYTDCVEIHAALLSRGHFSVVMRGDRTSVDQKLDRQRRNILRVSFAAAAALVILVGIVLKLISYQKPDVRVAMELSGDAEVSVRGRESQGGERLLGAGSRVSLKRGTASLKFVSGVKALIEAPIQINILEDGSVAMDGGKAWFEVSKGVEGFQVNLPGMSVLDLGTEFGIESASKTGGHRVHVIKGKVLVSSLEGKRGSMNLKAGDATMLNPIGRLEEIPFEGGGFHKSLPRFAGWIDVGLNERSHHVSSRTSGLSEANREYDGRDGQWGLALDSDQARASTNGRVWVARPDLGETVPELLTVLSGLAPGEGYQISLVFPVHDHLPHGVILAGMHNIPSREFSRENGMPTDTEGVAGYHEIRSVVGQTKATGKGEISVRLAPSSKAGSRSYISSIGVKSLPATAK